MLPSLSVDEPPVATAGTGDVFALTVLKMFV
jgi:hypothetical protein